MWRRSFGRGARTRWKCSDVLPEHTATERLGYLQGAVASRAGQTPEQVMDGWLAHTPAGRLGFFTEVGQVIAFLASPTGVFICGVSLPVDGGRVCSIWRSPMRLEFCFCFSRNFR